MRLAAIDIGSNAARLLISDVVYTPQKTYEFIKISLVRVPLRLGFDVFEHGSISPVKEEKILKTIKSYKHLLEVFDVEHFRACATSAMRDASNGEEIIRKIEKETGITIKIIDGQEEATLIYENHIADYMNKEESYLYVDVGGGSTELTFFSDGELVFKESFNIGTIRLLKNQVTESTWNQMKSFIKSHALQHHHVTVIGSGGNINKVFSLSKRKEGKPLTLDMLRDFYKEFSSLSLSERMSVYRLREDRADVIVPALLIYINVMRWADAQEIYVPKIGLADGLIHSLHEELYKNKVLST